MSGRAETGKVGRGCYSLARANFACATRRAKARFAFEMERAKTTCLPDSRTHH